jgi:hypothetical protein
MSGLTPAFVTQYQSEFSHVFQTMGSKLRPQVWVKNVTEASATKFPLLDVATSDKNAPIGQKLAFDQDQPHSSITVTFDRYRSARTFDNLEEFATNIDVRRGYSESVVAKLGRDMDAAILDSMKASNTSAGSSAALDMARIAKVTALTYKYNWPTGKRTMVITPSMHEKLLQITQFGSRDYNDGQPLKEGAPIRFMGWDFVVLPALETSTYWTSSTDQNAYAFFERAVGLGINKDISPRIDWVPDGLNWQVSAQGYFGAGTIQATGVLKVGVNGL